MVLLDETADGCVKKIRVFETNVREFKPCGILFCYAECLRGDIRCENGSRLNVRCDGEGNGAAPSSDVENDIRGRRFMREDVSHAINDEFGFRARNKDVSMNDE